MKKPPGVTTFGVFSSKPNSQSTTLMDILHFGHVDAKYYLSPKAAKGILRRAQRRGRTLPALLEQALREIAAKSHGAGRT